MPLRRTRSPAVLPPAGQSASGTGAAWAGRAATLAHGAAALRHVLALAVLASLEHFASRTCARCSSRASAGPPPWRPWSSPLAPWRPWSSLGAAVRHVLGAVPWRRAATLRTVQQPCATCLHLAAAVRQPGRHLGLARAVRASRTCRALPRHRAGRGHIWRRHKTSDASGLDASCAWGSAMPLRRMPSPRVLPPAAAPAGRAKGRHVTRRVRRRAEGRRLRCAIGGRWWRRWVRGRACARGCWTLAGDASEAALGRCVCTLTPSLLPSRGCFVRILPSALDVDISDNLCAPLPGGGIRPVDTRGPVHSLEAGRRHLMDSSVGCFACGSTAHMEAQAVAVVSVPTFGE